MAGSLEKISRVLGALPGPVPRRSLIPRLVAPPAVWLAPSRTIATFASGLFGFLFLVSAVLTLDPSMGGGGPGMFTTSTQRAAQQRIEAGRAPAAAVGAPAPAAAPAAAPLGPQGAGAVASPAQLAAPALAPRPSGVADSATSEAAKSASSPAPAIISFFEPPPSRPSIGSPFLWLALTVGAAVAALIFRRRMRRS